MSAAVSRQRQIGIVCLLLSCLLVIYNYEVNRFFGQTNYLGNNILPNPRVLQFYLHVGPGKMATTTIQHALQEDKGVLNMDGYCIFNPLEMQKTVGPMLRKGLLKTTKHEKWKDFRGFLDHCYDLQQHVLVSSEDLGLLNPDVWEKLLKPAVSRWHFNVVLGYRRWYAWLPSLYFQLERMKLDKENWGSVENIPSLLDWREDERGALLYTENYIRHWKFLAGSNINILIYNLHEDRNVMRTFYCKTLHGTKRACEKYSHYQSESQNIGFTLDYHRIAIAAYNVGLIDWRKQGFDFNEAADTIRLYFYETKRMILNDFPRSCLEGDDLEDVFQKSLELELKIQPDWHLANGGENEMRKDFEKNLGKWCTIDVDMVLTKFSTEIEACARTE